MSKVQNRYSIDLSAARATTATATTTTTKVVAKTAMRWRGLVSGGSGYLRAEVTEG